MYDLKTILQYTYLNLSFDKLRKKITNNVVTLFEHKNRIELICKDGYKKYCYQILADFIVDYYEQVLIISIKAKI